MSNLTYNIHKTPTVIEAVANLSWYAQDGSYQIRIVGRGATEEKARQTAELMLGQARAALHVAAIDGVPNRVPETSTEDAHERTDRRPQHAD